MSRTTSPLARPAGSPGAAARGQRWTPTPVWARRILWANLVGQIVIVVTGGAVRLTGSGLGCSTWPECEPGQFTPVMQEAMAWNPLIEFGNRTLAGVLLVVALATAWVVWRERHRARGYRLLGLVPLIGVLVQAVVGGLSVRLELHPAVVGGHFLLSMVLIAASAALLDRRREGDAPPRPLVSARLGRLARVHAALLVPVLVLGTVVTGAGPHSGDAEVASRFALDPAAVSRLHSASVWLYLAVLVAVVVVARRERAPARVRRRASVLLVVTLLQGLVGYVQYATGLPEVLVGAHMLGAAVLVVAQTRLLLRLRERAHTVPDRVVTAA